VAGYECRSWFSSAKLFQWIRRLHRSLLVEEDENVPAARHPCVRNMQTNSRPRIYGIVHIACSINVGLPDVRLRITWTADPGLSIRRFWQNLLCTRSSDICLFRRKSPSGANGSLPKLPILIRRFCQTSMVHMNRLCSGAC
jgi:hypothetical protein